MGRISYFKEKFEDIIEEVLEQDISTIDAHELGEVVDCLKDCAEAEYYCAIVEAMSEDKEYAAEMMPQSIRERMYFNTSNTFDNVMDELKEMMSNSSDTDITDMKQQLIAYINTL